MIIKNMTTETLPIVLKELANDENEYTVYIEKFSSTEIERNFLILNLGTLMREGKISIARDSVTEQPIPSAPEVTPDVETSLLGEESDSPSASPGESPTSLICDVCGAEFASLRGLNAHKSRVHPE